MPVYHHKKHPNQKDRFSKGGDEVHKGWHSRGYLPHFDHPGLIQIITFRLKDALPSNLFETYADELACLNGRERYQYFERHLDAGYGSCLLREPRIARVVEDALLYFDDKRYQLFAWVIMPNHVHVMIEMFPGYQMGKIIHSWKSFSAKQANKILKRNGAFWQPDYFDRFIRNYDHFKAAIEYIHNNPVRANIAVDPDDWQYSSAKVYKDTLHEMDHPC